MNDHKLPRLIILVVRKFKNTPNTRKHFLSLKMLIAWLKTKKYQTFNVLYFQNKVIQFTFEIMLQFDVKRLNQNNKILKFSHTKNGTIANWLHFKTY